MAQQEFEMSDKDFIIWLAGISVGIGGSITNEQWQLLKTTIEERLKKPSPKQVLLRDTAGGVRSQLNEEWSGK